MDNQFKRALKSHLEDCLDEALSSQWPKFVKEFVGAATIEFNGPNLYLLDGRSGDQILSQNFKQAIHNWLNFFNSQDDLKELDDVEKTFHSLIKAISKRRRQIISKRIAL